MFGWKIFHLCNQFNHQKERMRNKRSVKLLFAQWKVHTISNYSIMLNKVHVALEKHFKRKQRSLLLHHTFQKWVAFLYERHVEYRNDMLVARFKDRQYKKHIFAQWKKSCQFLEWNSLYLKQLEMRAIKHYVVRLLHAWHHEARRSHLEIESLAKRAQYMCFTHRPMLCWRSDMQNSNTYAIGLIAIHRQLCEYRFRRRRQLQKRFFRHIQKSLQLRNEHSIRMHRVARMHLLILLRKYMNRMHKATR